MQIIIDRTVRSDLTGRFGGLCVWLTERFGQRRSNTQSNIKRRFIMRTKKALLAVSTALVLFGAGSVALANDNAANTGEVGGSKIGPLGQVFSSGQSERGSNAYGQAYQRKHITHKQTVRPASK